MLPLLVTAFWYAGSSETWIGDVVEIRAEAWNQMVMTQSPKFLFGLCKKLLRLNGTNIYNNDGTLTVLADLSVMDDRVELDTPRGQIPKWSNERSGLRNALLLVGCNAVLRNGARWTGRTVSEYWKCQGEQRHTMTSELCPRLCGCRGCCHWPAHSDVLDHTQVPISARPYYC